MPWGETRFNSPGLVGGIPVGKPDSSFQRRRYRSRTLDDQPVRLRLAMPREIEGRVLVRQREVEIATRDRELVAFRRARGHDFTRRRDDDRVADLPHAIFI